MEEVDEILLDLIEKDKLLEKLCKDILTQRSYQKLGVLDTHKLTAEEKQHAQGGLDLALWLIENNPVIETYDV